MAFVQSTSGGSARNAGLLQFTLTFVGDCSDGNAIVVDILWRRPSGNLTVVDSAGNTFTRIFSSASGDVLAECWYSVNITQGVGVNTIYAEYTGSDDIDDIAMAIHEYANVANATPVDAFNTEIAVNSFGTASITTAHDIDVLHAFGANNPPWAVQLSDPTAGWIQREYVAGGYENMLTVDKQISTPAPSSQSITIVSIADFDPTFAVCLIALRVPPSPATPGTAWLVINEPGIRYTDRSTYLHLASDQTFTLTLRQRGTANLTLIVPAGDPYAPTTGTQCFLYDQNAAGSTLVFAGTIDTWEITWMGEKGYHLVKLTLVSFEQCFDALLVPPQSFFYQPAEDIFRALLASIAGGVPVVPGNIVAPTIVNVLQCNWDRLSDIFDQLATAAGCIWGVDLANLSVFLQPESANPSPFTLQMSDVVWESNTYDVDRTNFRNRQIIRISLDAFSQSSELFAGNGSQTSFTMMRPVDTVTFAWLTYNRQNTALGIFSGDPVDGDTVTIGYPNSGSIYNWSPNAPYAEGQIIVDPANHIQRVTTAGISGSFAPAWNDTGSTTTDPVIFSGNPSVIWQDLGLSGAGGVGASVYTFRNVIDNRVWGEVKIGFAPGQSAINLADAINANQATAGQAFSWPTWENPLVNADPPVVAIGEIHIRNKPAGQDYKASLATTSANFSWSRATTSGGSTTFGTTSLQIAAQGSSNSANLYYTPGSPVVSIFTPPASGQFLQVQYKRAAGDCIVVEDTALVNLRAAIENGTGKYQQLVSDTSNTSNTSGLQKAQAALAAFSVIPISFSFKMFKPGITTGQLLSISFGSFSFPASPAGIDTLVNGTYVVQEVSGSLIPAQPYMDSPTVPGGGHFEYTVKVINVSQIFDYLEFWQGLGGGGGGGGSVSAGAIVPAGADDGDTGGVAINGVEVVY